VGFVRTVFKVGVCVKFPIPKDGADGDFVGESAMEGRESNRLAPNDEVGLKGLIPPNPVTCGCRDETDGAVV